MTWDDFPFFLRFDFFFPFKLRSINKALVIAAKPGNFTFLGVHRIVAVFVLFGQSVKAANFLIWSSQTASTVSWDAGVTRVAGEGGDLATPTGPLPKFVFHFYSSACILIAFLMRDRCAF